MEGHATSHNVREEQQVCDLCERVSGSVWRKKAGMAFWYSRTAAVEEATAETEDEAASCLISPKTSGGPVGARIRARTLESSKYQSRPLARLHSCSHMHVKSFSGDYICPLTAYTKPKHTKTPIMTVDQKQSLLLLLDTMKKEPQLKEEQVIYAL